MSEFKATKQLLCKLVNARSVEILLGSGSLANDVIAGQISLFKQRGVILTNGEFGWIRSGKVATRRRDGRKGLQAH